jgi:hypothetical protein
MTNDEIVVEQLALIPIITGVTQVFKTVFKSEGAERLAPVIALMLGIIFNVGLKGFNFMNIFTGFYYGLSAMGLYSGIKVGKEEVKAFQEMRTLKKQPITKNKTKKTSKNIQ